VPLICNDYFPEQMEKVDLGGTSQPAFTLKSAIKNAGVNERQEYEKKYKWQIIKVAGMCAILMLNITANGVKYYASA